MRDATDNSVTGNVDLTVALGDTYARLRTLFAEVLDIEPAQRDAWLENNVADAEECAALRRLLAADNSTGGYFDVPLQAHVASMDAAEPLQADGLIGTRIGAFRLVRLLGRGGMAVVFLGERDDGDFRQQAAVKLLRRGLYSEVEQRLFRRERQLLAALEHPNIARVIDGGVTASGVPYLVLEYVDGVPITIHSVMRGLTVREQLELFLIVCRAVEAAHRGLIVHRDIKPSNILVTPAGDVKLLDFGIAKLLADDTDLPTVGACTPEYAAPEQLARTAVTTATDVYALGVLLHELLIGRRPASPPRRPSQEAQAFAPSSAMALALRGDLDTILLKCLDEEPTRRYASAGALASDIERHLAGKPVEAHPPSRWYRTRKFVGRHRAGVAFGAIFLVALLGALAFALWQTSVARYESARANRVKDFVEDMFAPIDNSVIEAKQTTLHDLLAQATQKLDRNTELAVGERVDLQMLFSRLHEKMGESDRALALAQQAAEQARSQLGPDDSETIAAQMAYAYALLEHEDLTHATPLLQELQSRVRGGARVTGMPLIQLYDALAELADRRGAHAEALDDERRALEERIAQFGAESAKTATGYNNVAISLDLSGHHAEAIDAFRRSYAIHLAHEGADSFETANARNNLATAELQIGRLQAARADFLAVEPLYEAAPNNKRNRNALYWQNRCLLAIAIGGAAEKPTCEHAARAADQILPATATRWRARGLRLDAQMRSDLGDFVTAREDLRKADALLGESGDAFTLGVHDYLRAELDAHEGDAMQSATGFAHAIERIAHSSPEYARLNALAALALACVGARGVDQSICPADAATQAQTELDAYDNRWNPWLLPAHIALARIDLDAGRSEAASRRLRQSIAAAKSEVDPAQLNLLLAQAWLVVVERRGGHCESSGASVHEAARAQGIENHPLLSAAFGAIDSAAACASAAR